MRRFMRPSIAPAVAIGLSALLGAGTNWGPRGPRQQARPPPPLGAGGRRRAGVVARLLTDRP